MSRQVLITGASAGIGEAFARSYAIAGSNLVLIARRKEKLESLADELRNRHRIEALCLEVDLSTEESPHEVMYALEQQDVKVDILINNAGYGVPGTFIGNEWEKHRANNLLMITNVAALTYLLLPNMISKREGAVINVASIAGMLPASAGHTLYGATKAWMIRFSEALADELKPSNVKVLAVCPGFTRSEFHDVTGTRESVDKLPAIFWMSSEEVADLSIDALSKARTTIFVPGKFNRFLVFLNKWLPTWIVRWLISRNSRIARRVE